MKFTPVFFKTYMVQSVLLGRKDMTRRIINPQPDKQLHDMKMAYWSEDPTDQKTPYIKCPYGQPGDIIWIREKFFINKRPTGAPYWYYAGEDHDFTYPDNEKWKPSIHMPKDAARIFLQIKSIKVERLQDISEQDAKREGLLSFTWQLSEYPRYKDYTADASGYGDPLVDFPTVATAKESFQTLWTLINGKDNWNFNPWVWVIDFKRVSKPKNFIS